MDPNATLTALRALCVTILSEKEDATNDETDFAELFSGLDEWVATGGFLPDAWRQEDRFLAQR